ncbi:hypothetical protein Dimus_033422, partial [Dionaea muscipula]
SDDQTREQPLQPRPPPSPASSPHAVAGQLTPRRRRPAHPTPSPSPSSISPDADNWPSANCHPPPQVSPIAPAAAVDLTEPHVVAVQLTPRRRRRRPASLPTPTTIHLLPSDLRFRGTQ